MMGLLQIFTYSFVESNFTAMAVSLVFLNLFCFPFLFQGCLSFLSMTTVLMFGSGLVNWLLLYTVYPIHGLSNFLYAYVGFTLTWMCIELAVDLHIQKAYRITAAVNPNTLPY